MGKRRSTLNIFLDSSVLFSAVNSVVGGSAKIFTIRNIKLFVSKVVLHEVEKNVRTKLQNYHLTRFFRLVSCLTIIEGKFLDVELKRAKKIIVEKDSAILADFKRSDCSILLTLDKKDFLQEKVFKFVKPKKILTPKQFFEEHLP